ncbi:putative phosphotransferase enzyme family protein [Botrytis fragariae]|uniref:Putative phosphotransferase enzyme family protein n=1 Tax=Botrytis fragariae TaxID=1964551 RepID=A0A8H6AVJ4_9HELO|nr:putative phosphotransferase enzyme family protein [Botrytis fragariae]KAF5874511.1 putative phosphotransferase enzyme family protein [Botrytis fragariae]
MHFDSVAQREQQRNFMVWFQRLLQSEPEQIACQISGKHRPGNRLIAVRWKTGGYRVTYRVTYDDGFQAIVRFAALGRSLHLTEKVENEAIVLQYLRKRTKIRVRRLLGVGKIALAPYIVEESVEQDLASGPFMDSRIELQNFQFLLTLKSAQSATTLLPCNENSLSFGITCHMNQIAFSSY